MNDIEYCISCGTVLLPLLDDDPNGAKNAICARCTAEEDYNFDRYPRAVFDRSGREIERRRIKEQSK